jgi:O-antigen/teichoic acid export membrane protein
MNVRSRPATLRSNFASTFAGNVLFAASQWAILSLIAKLGDSEMLGRYALAVAVATPIAMFSHLNLRAVLATDIARRHPFGDYLVVRLGTTALGLAAIALIAFVSGNGRQLSLAIVGIGVTLSIDNVSDIYYGLLQRRERMDQIAISMAMRGLLSAAALGIALWLTGNLLAGIAALACVRLSVLLFHDRPKGSAGEHVETTAFDAQFRIFRTAAPLGIVLMLIALTASLPRYAIEGGLGPAALGAFAAVASFMTAASTAVNALGQAATPRLARHFSSAEFQPFRRLAVRLILLAFLLGVAGVLAAAVFGSFVLGLVYRPSYSAYADLLVRVMAAGALSYVAITLGYVITSARAFVAQAPLLAMVAGASGAGSWVLVPRLGLNGAVLALAIAYAVQIGGEVIILRHAMRRARTSL